MSLPNDSDYDVQCCIGMLVKPCMYVGQECCRIDFMFRMVYDKVEFSLLAYLMHILMILELLSLRVARAAV